MTLLPGEDCILMYHGTPRRHAARLARQLRAIAFLFDVVPLGALASRVARGERAGRRRLALTFDDGLRSNVQVAYPILRELGLPATFFVCPGLIDEGRWLWTHEARQRLGSLPREALSELGRAVGAPAEAHADALVQWMKTRKLAERRRIEQAIRAATPRFVPRAAEREAYDLAGWDELAMLDPRIVSIGSHTLTHPILTSLGADELDREVRESRSRIEAKLGRPATLFCYPNGELDALTLAATRRCYAAAVTVEEASLDEDVDPYRLPRLATEPDQSLRLARHLAFPGVRRAA
ncbi:MAG TPA: polysaccharide deacetylase family protein [Burkholderiales bacterium]|nr:polysaccharide deacetylase family protein [Burkholderiales bacterium]